MEKHELSQLETHIRELGTIAGRASDIGDLEELIRIIHQPGWTTLPELLFTRSYVNQITAMYRNAAELRQTLLHAAREVGKKTSATAA